jgi:carbonic anhydrase
MSAIDEVLEANRAFVSGYDGCRLPSPPARRLVILTCMDARIDPVRAFGLHEGDAHVLRNAGGVVTDDVIRSLMLSQRVLGTREIMLVHHTQCGAFGLRDHELSAEIEGETGVRPPFPLQGFTDLDADVRESMARLRSTPFLASKEAIRGFVYNVETGALREVL